MMKTLLLCASIIFSTTAYAEDVQPHLFDDLNGNGISDSVEAKDAAEQAALQQTPAPQIPVDPSTGNAQLVDVPEGGA